MPYTVIENFRFGLDTRRSILTSQVGTLLTLQDAHVNQGGECEKRKAFVGIDTTPTAASHVTNVLGMQDVASSIVLFGGERNDDAIHWPPYPFTYQRLTRTLASGGLIVNAVAVVYSTTFAGKTFVIATMSDGSTCLFYDAVQISDSYAGTIPTGFGSTFMQYTMVEAVNATGVYTAVRNAGDGSVDITGPVGKGSDFDVTITTTGTVVLTSSLQNGPVDQVPGQIAVGAFRIVAGTTLANVNKITSIKANTTQLITGSRVDYNTSNVQTAADVVTNINNNTNTSGFNAKNVADVITIYANSIGTTDNGFVVEVISAGNLCVSDSTLAFSGTGFTLDYVRVNSLVTAAQTDILGGVQTHTNAETLAAFATKVEGAINAGTGVHGFIACGVGALLKISPAKSRSDDKVNPIEAGYTVTGGQTGGVGTTTGDPLNVIPTPTSLGLSLLNARTGTFASPTGQQVTVQVTGGTPPYTYLWTITTPDNTIRLTPTTPANNSTSVYGLVTNPGSSHRTSDVRLVYTVTDQGGTTVTGFVPILLP